MAGQRVSDPEALRVVEAKLSACRLQPGLHFTQDDRAHLELLARKDLVRVAEAYFGARLRPATKATKRAVLHVLLGPDPAGPEAQHMLEWLPNDEGMQPPPPPSAEAPSYSQYPVSVQPIPQHTSVASGSGAPWLPAVRTAPGREDWRAYGVQACLCMCCACVKLAAWLVNAPLALAACTHQPTPAGLLPLSICREGAAPTSGACPPCSLCLGSTRPAAQHAARFAPLRHRSRYSRCSLWCCGLHSCCRCSPLCHRCPDPRPACFPLSTCSRG